jgi:hypothetical protein
MWKEGVVANLLRNTVMFLEGLRKTTTDVITDTLSRSRGLNPRILECLKAATRSAIKFGGWIQFELRRGREDAVWFVTDVCVLVPVHGGR